MRKIQNKIIFLIIAIFLMANIEVVNADYDVSDPNKATHQQQTVNKSCVDGTFWNHDLQAVRIRIYNKENTVIKDKYFVLKPEGSSCSTNNVISNITLCETGGYAYESIIGNADVTCSSNQTLSVGCISGKNLEYSIYYSAAIKASGVHLQDYFSDNMYYNLKDLLTNMGYVNSNPSDFVIVEPVTRVVCAGTNYVGTSTALMMKNVSYSGSTNNACSKKDGCSGNALTKLYNAMSNAFKISSSSYSKSTAYYGNYSYYGYLKYDISKIFNSNPTCANQFDSESTMKDRITLYNDLKLIYSKDNYNGLLDMDKQTVIEACSDISKNDYTKDCLNVKTDVNFSQNNISMYTEKYGDYVFCQVTFDLKSNLEKNSLDQIKAGQAIISKTGAVATATLQRVCYNFDNETSTSVRDFDYYNYVEEKVSLKFEKNAPDNKDEEVILAKNVIPKPIKFTEDGGIVETIIVEYSLPTMYASNKDGKVYYSKDDCPLGEYCKYIGNGVISRFNLAEDTYLYSLNIKFTESSNLGTIEDKEANDCTYTVEPEVVVNDKLNLVFRTIDTNSGKAFLSKTGSGYRNMGSNWGDLPEEELDRILNKNNNSYNRNDNVLYTITLTPSVIKDIRAYNKTTSYDDYNMICDDKGELCVSKFLTDLNSTYIKDKVKVLELYESENRKWYKELNS